MKTCSKCGLEKLLTEFHRNRSMEDGLQYWCKSCRSTANRIHKQATIYALCDPFTNAVRYIGATVTSLQKRLGQHLNTIAPDRPVAEWVQALVTQGIQPIIRPIAIVEVSEMDQVERRVIALYLSQGVSLLNRTDGGRGSGFKIAPEVFTEKRRARRRAYRHTEATKQVLRELMTSRTHCVNGHEFTPNNTYVYKGRRDGQRKCRACHRKNGRIRAA